MSSRRRLARRRPLSPVGRRLRPIADADQQATNEHFRRRRRQVRWGVGRARLPRPRLVHRRDTDVLVVLLGITIAIAIPGRKVDGGGSQVE